jgi:hypothetical protein
MHMDWASEPERMVVSVRPVAEAMERAAAVPRASSVEPSALPTMAIDPPTHVGDGEVLQHILTWRLSPSSWQNIPAEKLMGQAPLPLVQLVNPHRRRRSASPLSLESRE